MIDQELNILKLRVLHNTVIWMWEGAVARVERIGKREEMLEPNWCAYLDDGTWISLHDCALSDFYILTPIANK